MFRLVSLLIFIILTALTVSSCGSESETNLPSDSTTFAPVDATDNSSNPELVKFTAAVDYACASNFNLGQVKQAQIDFLADQNNWSTEKRVALEWYQQQKTQYATYRTIANLGKPPAKQELFQQWRDNVRQRAGMMKRLASLAANSQYSSYHTLYDKLLDKKIASDKLAVKFGLSICPSNGPANNTD